ncbi:hypothetical protein BH24ACT5_BH24ACT5_03710 [soil metagenome]
MESIRSTLARPVLVGVERVRRDPDAAVAYDAAVPFPHTVISELLTSEAFHRVAAEFPLIDDPGWNGYLHVNETKYANPDPATWPAALRDLARELCSDDFVAFLGELTGIDGLIADWSMDGGGLHQTPRGGHLNVHTDFTAHHVHSSWRRRINVLLYLNEEWKPEWGGALELWPADMSARACAVDPTGNTMLVFTTSGSSFHGHPDPLRCPEGVARRSLALYYFTDEGQPARHATNYRARPGDGAKAVAIWVDRFALRVYDVLKRRFKLSDTFVQAVLTRVHRLRPRGLRR